RAQVRALRVTSDIVATRLAMLQPERTNDRGEFRVFGLTPGEYLLSATPAGSSASSLNMPSSSADGETEDYGPTYYPSVPSIASAQRVRVGLSQEIANLNIALAPTPLARITGTAFTSTGAPMANAVVRLSPTAFLADIASARAKADGSFELRNIPPDQY